MSHFLDDLNESQKQAVLSSEGPVLIVAGPGTGKTLTIVRRIACLIHQGARPESILAVTFTNRAAREMRERTEALLGSDAGKIFIGTFHLLGLRIIRDSGGDEFVILNRDEQVGLLKSLTKDSARKAQEAVDRISRIKNYLVSENPSASPFSKGGPTEFPPLTKGGEGGFGGEIKGIYEAYQAALKQRNALDFDDLIVTPIELLQNSDIARTYQDRFKYIIVDEYQDINPAQYCLLRLLAGPVGNVCAVGDPDQAIYAFRGADLENFLNFEKDFPGAARITLARNYRSTATVLNAADTVIKNNQKRITKELVPTREQGTQISLLSVPDERAEGAFIVQEIEHRMGGTSHYQQYANGERPSSERSFRFSDFAVIYRTNALAKALEETFRASGIPYQVIGRRSNAQTKEIEETIAYLRSLIQPGHAAGPAPVDAADAREAKLLTAADFFDPRADAVALMTLHMAKGLEFPVVFITGCEEGLVPCTIMKDGIDIEEERRLFYVGMTRAKDELFLLHSRRRFLYGQQLTPSPSPFLSEIPGKFIGVSIVPDRVKKEKEQEQQLGLF
jgi:DNA helicase II / ATP-dependent DNA helicase PcrA